MAIFQNIIDDTRGGFAIISALVMGGLIVFLSLVLDISRANFAHAIMQNSADLASVACVKRFMETEDEAAAIEEGERFYFANTRPVINYVRLSSQSPDFSVDAGTEEDSTVRCNATAMADLETSNFARMATGGTNQMPLGVLAEAMTGISDEEPMVDFEIVFAFDVSKSMQPSGVAELRQVAMQTVTDLYDAGIDNIAVGFVNYGPGIVAQQDPNADVNTVLAGIEQMQIAARGGTDIYSAFAEANAMLDRFSEFDDSGNPKVEIIVMMTDGAHTGTDYPPTNAGIRTGNLPTGSQDIRDLCDNFLQRDDRVIHGVGYATIDPWSAENLNEPSQINLLMGDTNMTSGEIIAECARNGIYNEAENGEELQEVYDSILAMIGETQMAGTTLRLSR